MRRGRQLQVYAGDISSLQHNTARSEIFSAAGSESKQVLCWGLPCTAALPCCKPRCQLSAGDKHILLQDPVICGKHGQQRHGHRSWYDASSALHVPGEAWSDHRAQFLQCHQ